MTSDCVFCRILEGKLRADIVDESETTITFLDSGPVFPGHLLIVPRTHYATFLDLPAPESGPFLQQMQRASKAVEFGLGSEGSFVAINVKVSQTVAHLHAHVIPRTKGDGMKGFFWPRRPYSGDDHRTEIVAKLRAAFVSL